MVTSPLNPSRFVLFLSVAVVALSACEMTSPSYVSTSPITVEEGHQERLLPVSAITVDLARQIADHYNQYGKGPLTVLVLYGVDKGADLQAQKDAVHVVDTLKKAGLTNVQVETLPIQDPSKVGMVRIDYVSLKAHAPAGCPAHPGDSRQEIIDSKDGQFPDYRYGCGVDSYIAGQVARPADLLGADNIDSAAGERGSAQLKDYREGKPFKKLEGSNASQLKTN